MQIYELSAEEVDAASGGNLLAGAAMGWLFSRLADGTMSYVGNLLSNGAPADLTKSNAMGDMY